MKEKKKLFKKEIVIDGIMPLECDHKYLYWFYDIRGVKKCKVNTKIRTVSVTSENYIENGEFYKKLENTGYKILEIKDV